MIWFFDTSVLVAVFYADHPHHVESQRAYLKSGKKDCCALRTIGELYATLTGLPLRPRINGSEGMEVVRQVCKRLSLISLSETEYWYALSEAASRVVGGGVYDALIAHSKQDHPLY